MVLKQIGKRLRDARMMREHGEEPETLIVPRFTTMPLRGQGGIGESAFTPYTSTQGLTGPQKEIYIVEKDIIKPKEVTEGEEGGININITSKKSEGSIEEEISKKIRESPFQLKFKTLNIEGLKSGEEERREEAPARKGIKIKDAGLGAKTTVGMEMQANETIKLLRQVNRVVPLVTISQGVEKKVVAYATIKWSEENQELVYSVREPVLTDEEKALLDEIKDILKERLNVDFGKIRGSQAYNYIITEFNKVIRKIGIKLTSEQQLKFNYYVYRDFIGLEKLEPLMHDPNIEDIGCVGYGIPIFLYHRDPLFNQIATNVIYKSKQELDSFVLKLAQKCGKSLTLAEPLMDGALPGGSRVQVTLGVVDIARRGSNFTIRKFTERPMTPVDLIKLSTIDADTLAYLWLVIESNMSVLISGATATGKTTFLNALSLFIKPEFKIISIEDSVTGDAEVILDNDGIFERKSVEELFNDLKASEDQTRIELSGLKLHTLGRENKIILAEPSVLLRHKVCKEIYEIITKSGRVIKTTGDHSLFSLGNDGNVSAAAVRDLKINDFIAIPRFLPNNKKIDSVNLMDNISLFRNVFFQGEEIRKLLKKEGVIKMLKPGARKYNYWAKNGIIPCEELDRIIQKLKLKINPENVKICPQRSGVKLPAILHLTPNFLAMTGLWIAEGCYDKNSVLITNTNEECRKLVQDSCKELGMKTKNHSDKATMMINSSVLKQVFEKVLKLTGKAYTKRMPSWMLNLSKEQTGCVLKGYFSGDGCATNKEVEASSCSKNLIKDLQNALLQFGIIARTTWRKEKDNTYKIRIGDTCMLKEFEKNVGFVQDYKKKALRKLCSRISTHGTSDVIPLPNHFYKSVKKVLKNHDEIRLTYKSWKSWSSRYAGNNSNIGRNYLQRVMMNVNSTPEEKVLKKLCNNDIYWDKIRSIKNLGVQELFVYDFSVPETENFICNGVIAHNTAELRLPHPNWIAEVARHGFGGKAYGEVTMYDLLKAGLRQRPDYIIVGEVRGEEAVVMFQGMASIAGEEEVFLINEHNEPVFVQIKDLKNPKKYKSFCVNSGNSKILPVNAWTEHKAVELYKITTKKGREVITSPNHSLLTYENSEIIPLTVENAVKGDKIMIPRAIKCGFNDLEYYDLTRLENARILMPELIKKAVETIGFKEACNITGLKSVNDYYSKKPVSAMHYNIFKKLMDNAGIIFEKKDLIVKFDRKSKAMPALLPLNNELLRLLGYYISEGSLNTAYKNNSIQLYNKDEDVLNDMRSCLKGFSGNINERITKGFGECTELCLNNKVLFEFLKQNCNHRAGNKTIPSFIFGLSKERISQLLTALYTGDGSVRQKGITYYTKSRKLADKLTILLTIYGVVAKISHRKGVYEISFTKKDYIKEFLEHVKPINKTIIVTGDGRKDACEIKDFYLDKIKNIEKIVPEEAVKVYDISVPGAQNFISGFGGMLLHNTGHPGLGTIHADSMPAVVDRLTNKPIDLPKTMLDNLDVVVFLEKFKVKGRFIRKVKEIAEIVGYDYNHKELITNSAFRWDARRGEFLSFDSVILDKIQQKSGSSLEELRMDMNRRIKLLNYLVKENMNDYRKFSTFVNKYYNNPSFVESLPD